MVVCFSLSWPHVFGCLALPVDLAGQSHVRHRGESGQASLHAVFREASLLLPDRCRLRDSFFSWLAERSSMNVRIASWAPADYHIPPAQSKRLHTAPVVAIATSLDASFLCQLTFGRIANSQRINSEGSELERWLLVFGTVGHHDGNMDVRRLHT